MTKRSDFEIAKRLRQISQMARKFLEHLQSNKLQHAACEEKPTEKK